MKRGRHVQHQRDLVALLRGQRGNVLELRGVEGVEDTRDVHHRAHIGTVETVIGLRRVTELHGQVAGRSGGQRFHDRLAVPIVEDQRFPALGEAGSLHFRHPIQALVVDLHAQAARQQRRRILEPPGIGGVDVPHSGEIDVEPGTVEHSLIQILRRAHK